MLELIFAALTLEIFLLTILLMVSAVTLMVRAIGEGVGKLILLAQLLKKTAPTIDGAYFVNTPSGHRLSTQKISFIDSRSNKKSDKYIIAFCPNAASYSDPGSQDFYKELSYITRSNIIAFDYPNVGNSSKGRVRTQDPLVEAGMAQVQRLLNQGVPANNITLYGWSLGGAAAAFVAADCHLNGQKVSIISDRSFSTIGDTVAGRFGISFLKYIFNPVCNLLNWNMNAAAAYKNLPQENKMLIFSEKDEIIHPQIASLASSITTKSNFDLTTKRGHNDCITESMMKHIVDFMDQPRDVVKTPTDTSRVEVMTWGTAPFDSKYLSPIMKGFQHLNSGHGAFVLNLTDTPEHRKIYFELAWAGYPYVEMMQPLGGCDKKGKPLKEKRYLVRFSPCWNNFADYESEQLMQRHGTAFLMNPERFRKFQEQENAELPEVMTKKFEGTKLSEISKQSKAGASLYQGELRECTVKHILHTDRLTQKDLDNWDKRDLEASGRLYETSGQAPDRIDNIPISNDQFGFGLDLTKLAAEMLRIKNKANKKIYAFVYNTKNTHEGNPRRLVTNIQIEQNLLAAADPTKNADDLKISFDNLMMARDKLAANTERTEIQERALIEFYELFDSYQRYASNKNIFIHEMMSNQFNCCAVVKNCIREGLDSSYKGYLTESLTSDLFTVPLELAQEAASVGDAIYQDRANATPKSKRPPIASMIKGVCLAGRNLNYTFLPSRTLIRPAFILIDTVIHAPVGLVKAVYNCLPQRVVKIKSNLQITEKMVRHSYEQILTKVLKYNQYDKPFFIDPKTYEQIVTYIQSIENNFLKARASLQKKFTTDEIILEKDRTQNAQKSEEVFSKRRAILIETFQIYKIGFAAAAKQEPTMGAVLKDLETMEGQINQKRNTPDGKSWLFDQERDFGKYRQIIKFESNSEDQLKLLNNQNMENFIEGQKLDKIQKQNTQKLEDLKLNRVKLEQLKDTPESIKWMHEQLKLPDGPIAQRLEQFQTKYNEILQAQTAAVTQVVKTQMNSDQNDPITLQYAVYCSPSSLRYDVICPSKPLCPPKPLLSAEALVRRSPERRRRA